MTSTRSPVSASVRALRAVLIIIALLVPLTAAGARAGVVRAVLFFSPSCPHCHEVMETHVPPLLAQYGDALRIVAVNVETAEGQTLYQLAAGHFALPMGGGSR